MHDTGLILALLATSWVGIVSVTLTSSFMRRSARWKALPCLEDYARQFPLCRTQHGIVCRVCMSGSLHNTGLHTAGNGRRTVSCNACGTPLYRLHLPRVS